MKSWDIFVSKSCLVSSDDILMSVIIFSLKLSMYRNSGCILFVRLFNGVSISLKWKLTVPLFSCDKLL